MSVTFHPELGEPVGYVVSCGCTEATALAAPYQTYETACGVVQQLNALPERAALPGCTMPEICPEYRLHVYELDADGEPPVVDVSSVNATRLLPLLGLSHQADDAVDELTASGLPEAPGEHAGQDDGSQGTVIPICVTDSSGQLPAEQFLGRVLLALALTPEDPGTDGYEQGRTYYGGRSAGYLQRRLLELHDLAQWCAAHGRDVVWG
ncbi:hypothetical protein PV726_32410 [Streptomyces europaeiscabiei]|uniref:hypothetical protein n=1 Tax=Streptomyces europaeiscabiei TaxID=146819 RepID=UPI0029B80E5C|nr:hypothetical protein [Streptomyces europaeiscabiei]MDX3694961.1 hypothetical protein [Streptomyces europaeiscabiei]